MDQAAHPTTTPNTEDHRPLLFYGFDPLCSWCYAFCDTIEALVEAVGDAAQWSVLCGGLVTGERVQPIGALAAGMRQRHAALEAQTGVRFGESYRTGVLAAGGWRMDSEPGVRATLLVERLYGGAAAVRFGSALGRALYHDGMVQDDPKTLRACAQQAGVSEEGVEAFVGAWAGEEARRAATAHMQQARASGVTSYPMLLTPRGDGRVRALLRGHTDTAHALALIRAWLEQRGG